MGSAFKADRYALGMLRATVRNGWLTMDEPTELPEGTVLTFRAAIG